MVYNRIVSDITQGVELKKYQSKRLKDLNYNDDMLSHWGIQHFHLGAALGKDGFVSRTGDLLFIHFTNSQAYIIGLFPHNNWCDLDIIEKIHQNWPEILIEHKYSSNDQFLTEEEYKTLRAKNYNALVTVQDGTKYLPPGSGVMCDGTPIGAINKLQKLMMIFEKSFNDISLNIDQIFESDPKKQKSDTVTIGLEINDMNQRCVYVIKETGHRFTLNY